MQEDNLEQRQPPETERPREVASDGSVQTRIDFARPTFGNIQELNRTIDAKANYLLASVALLTAALGLVVSRAVAVTAQEDWQRVLKGGTILLMLLYPLAFTVIFVATGIYQARSQRPSANAGAPGMLFPLMLLRRYTVADQAGDILQDYSNQQIEVSLIYEAKQKQVNLCLSLFRLTGILGLMTMLVVVTVIVVLP